MPNITIRETDQIMMSLVHFFVTKENYAPISVQGAKDEIWLEKLDGPYRIIRISCNPIINEEQFKFDILKTKHVLRQIKRKTLSFKINALNIYLDLNKKIDNKNIKNIDSLNIESIDDIKKNSDIIKLYPNINKELFKSQDGFEFLVNVTSDINEHTAYENEKFSKLFSPKLIVFTNIYSLLCIIMYVILAISSKNIFDISVNTLVNFGANNILLVKSHQIYRLITSAFLHGSLIHLIVNLYSLRIIGSMAESVIGKRRFMFIFIISMITSSLMSLIFLDSTYVSVGASGVIFGLMGSLLYFGYHYRLYLHEALRNQIIPVIIINIIIGFIIPGIDIGAHIGGLVGGYLATMAIGILDKSHKKDMINGVIALVIYILFLNYIVFFVK